MLALTMSAISNTIAPAHFSKALDQTLKKKIKKINELLRVLRREQRKKGGFH